MIQAALGLPATLAEDAAETLHTTYGEGTGQRTAGGYLFIRDHELECGHELM